MSYNLIETIPFINDPFNVLDMAKFAELELLEGRKLAKPLREPAYKQDFNIQFPHSEKEVESRAQISAFRLQFVQRIAADISVKFSSSTPQRRVDQ